MVRAVAGKRTLTVSLSDEVEFDSELSFRKQNGEAASVIVQNKPRTKRQKAKQGSVVWHK